MCLKPPNIMNFTEFMCFAADNIAIGVRVTSGAVLLIDWMDLSALTASQLRKIARVLGSQRVPVEPDNGDIKIIENHSICPGWGPRPGSVSGSTGTP